MKITINFPAGNGMEMKNLMSWLDVTSTMLQCSGIARNEPNITVERYIEDILFQFGGNSIKRSELVDSIVGVDEMKLQHLPIEQIKEAYENEGLFMACCYLWAKNSRDTELCFGYALKDNIWVPHCWLIKENTICELSKYEFEKYCGQSFSGKDADKASEKIWENFRKEMK